MYAIHKKSKLLYKCQESPVTSKIHSKFRFQSEFCFKFIIEYMQDAYIEII